MSKFHQGIFKPTNPQKYDGDPTQIIFRSSWESLAMKWLDSNPQIISWSSECTIIPYICPTDDKAHRYFVDFFVKSRKADGSTSSFLVEIKPASQTVPPKYPGKQTKRYLTETMTFMKNQAKWKAAEEYCRKKGWSFVILTEKHLGLKK